MVPCVLEMPRSRGRRSSRSWLTGRIDLGISLTSRCGRRPLRPLLRRTIGLCIERCGLLLFDLREWRDIPRGRIICRIPDHHSFIPTEHSVHVLVYLGGFALAPGGRELASFAFATTSYAGWRAGVIDACSCDR